MHRWLLLALLGTCTVPAISWADPLRVIPKSATLVVHVENPRKLVEAVTSLDVFGQYQSLPQVKQLLQAPQARQFFQLIAHLEKALGGKWPELLDKLGGRGLALGTVPGVEPAPFVAVLEGKEQKAVSEAFDLLIELIEAELSRQAGSDTVVKLPRVSKAGMTTVNVGEFQFARVGTTVLLTSSEPLMRAAAGRVNAEPDSVTDSICTIPGFQQAQTLLGPKSLASLWFNLLPVKETKAGKDFFVSTRKDFLQTVVVGSTIDAVRRSDYVALGLFGTSQGLRLSLRMPAKRAGLPKEFGMHVPMMSDGPATLPLLEPPGVLFSQSLHLDLAAMWKDRKALFNEQNLKDIEKGIADITKLLPGTTIENLFHTSGPHHRFVAVERGQDQYTGKPDTVIPEMAIVSTMRQPEFASGMNTTLRAAGLVASLQLNMKMTEEIVDGVKITSYRFPEKGEYTGDPDRLRFNFVPCFAATEKEFLLGTSPRLLKDLLVELKKPIRETGNAAAVWRGKAYGTGAATAIRQRPDAFITNAVLSRGIGLKQAKAEIAELATFLESLGTVEFALDHTTEAYQFDMEWKRK